MRSKSDEEVIAEGFNLAYVIDAYHNLTAKGYTAEEFFTPMFEKLVGVDYVRKMITEGHSAEQISLVWREELEQFKALRQREVKRHVSTRGRHTKGVVGEWRIDRCATRRVRLYSLVEAVLLIAEIGCEREADRGSYRMTQALQLHILEFLLYLPGTIDRC